MYHFIGQVQQPENVWINWMGIFHVHHGYGVGPFQDISGLMSLYFKAITMGYFLKLSTDKRFKMIKNKIQTRG